MSPKTLQRKYMPTTGKKHKPHPTHPTTTPTTAAAQAQPPNINYRSQTKTKNNTTPNRHIILTPFRPDFEQQTKYELACAFYRPIKTYKKDHPYYPWLPPTPLINFNLNYKY